MKENLQENGVTLHIDYFKSFNDTQQDEIQSAYFGNLIFSIFTVRYSTMEESYSDVLLLLSANPVTTRECDHSHLRECDHSHLRECDHSHLRRYGVKNQKRNRSKKVDCLE